jgi:MFS transporter, AAHS family, 4-hydroxybenzoate transporter
MASSTGSSALDVTKLIDDGGLSRFQMAVVLLCGLVAILDGADTTSIAIAASTIAGLLNFPMSAFGVVFAAGTLGAMLGAMTFGPLADRFGRKRLLIVATVLFAIFTFLIAHATSYSTLVLYRFLAGLGLGGATPCFLALVSEYVPQRIRGTVVSVLWAAFPLGIMLGGVPQLLSRHHVRLADDLLRWGCLATPSRGIAHAAAARESPVFDRTVGRLVASEAHSGPHGA